MPKANRPLKVFLSYASQDKPLVRELSRRLVSEGWIDTWQDEKNLLPGQDWRAKIEEAVEEADVVIIVLSQHSVSKEGHVQKELRYAREIALEKPEDAIFLIPLRLDECEVPRGLRFYQWVDYFGENKYSSYKALIDSLQLRYEQKIKTEESEYIHKEQQNIAEKVAHEKERLRIAKQKAGLEAAERERKEKGLREKQTREIEKEQKQTTVKAQIVRRNFYWLMALGVVVLGVILFFSLTKQYPPTEPTPEDNQTQVALTPTYTKIVEPSVTSKSPPILTPTITPTFVPLSAVTNIDFTLTTFSGIRLGVNYVNCPKVIANITANGQGTVTYHWTRSDGVIAPTKKLFFSEAGTKSISEEWSLGSVWAGGNDEWLGVYIDSPNNQDFGRISVSVCTSP